MRSLTLLFIGHFFNLFLSELNHRLGDSALLLSDFMLPAIEGDNLSKVTLRPLDRRKSLEHKWPYIQEGQGLSRCCLDAVAWAKISVTFLPGLLLSMYFAKVKAMSLWHSLSYPSNSVRKSNSLGKLLYKKRQQCHSGGEGGRPQYLFLTQIYQVPKTAGNGNLFFMTPFGLGCLF